MASSPLENESITLQDDRVLSYAIYGAQQNVETTIFYFHAFPSSRFEGRMWHDSAKRLNSRLIVPDRPGMGNSTIHPGRKLLDWPNDIIALAEHLGVRKFYIMGMSGGGPYVLACLKALGKERLAGAACVAALYPPSLGTAGMLFGNRMLLWVAPWVPSLVSWGLDSSLGKAARNEDPKVLADLIMKDMASRPQVDQDAVKDEKNRNYLIEPTREGVRVSGQGAATEAALFGSDWGFKLEDIDGSVPVTLWHGEKDINAPVHMPKSVAEIIPGAVLKVHEEEGHVSLAFKYKEEILKDLVGR